MERTSLDEALGAAGVGLCLIRHEIAAGDGANALIAHSFRAQDAKGAKRCRQVSEAKVG